jgi:hypothetical protein
MLFTATTYLRVAPKAPAAAAQLQGLNPKAGPLTPTRRLTLPIPRFPLEFSLPRVLLQLPWRHPRASSAHDLRFRLLTVATLAGLQRINR